MVAIHAPSTRQQLRSEHGPRLEGVVAGSWGLKVVGLPVFLGWRYVRGCFEAGAGLACGWLSVHVGWA